MYYEKYPMLNKIRLQKWSIELTIFYKIAFWGYYLIIISKAMSIEPDKTIITMPEKLIFAEYNIFYHENGIPPSYPIIEPNMSLHPASMIFGKTFIDHYGNSKFYSSSRSGDSIRQYPPLYHGDIFPVLGELYYFDKPYHASRVHNAELLTGKNIVIPLTPPDVLSDKDCYNPRVYCRKTNIPENDWFSLVGITKDCNDNLSATILSGFKYIGSFEDRQERGTTIDSFRICKKYKVGDIIVTDYRNDDSRKILLKNTSLIIGYRITKIVPSDSERTREVKVQNGIRKGRLIGWIELDPTPIPLDETSEFIKTK
jgi:hypothetical protein